MRTPQELQKLLQRLYNAKTELDTRVNGADTAECTCPGCELDRRGQDIAGAVIDAVLYVLGVDSNLSKFTAAADLRDELVQARLEEAYAARDAAEAQQVPDNERKVVNARFN